LRQGEHYILWWKTLRDSSWKKIYLADTLHTIATDSVAIIGQFASDLPLDSLTDALITIQAPNVPVTQSYPLIESHGFIISADKRTATAGFDSKNILGDFSSLQASLVFTSPLADTLAYNHEFYLMNYADKTPALQSLPLPPDGWKYGLWVEDSAFTPHEYFFYGLFSAPAGHDSDSANDHYAFPGGWKPQKMNASNGSIFVTLEPLFYGDSLKYVGPSSFTLLRFDRIPFINKNQNYPMITIAAGAIPNGLIIFRK
jgi:hypothetical protein